MERSDLGRFDVIESQVLGGQAILWVAAENGEPLGAVVTQIEETERSNVCVIRACGGVNIKQWIGLLPLIEDYARDFGCNKVRFAGRKGWERLLKNYTQKRVIMERLL